MIYVFLADGFEEVEALTPVDYLRRCELSVQTVGVTGKLVRGSHGITVQDDRFAGRHAGYSQFGAFGCRFKHDRLLCGQAVTDWRDLCGAFYFRPEGIVKGKACNLLYRL